MTSDFQNHPHPRTLPSNELSWPDARDVRTQVQQLKATAQASHVTAIQPPVTPSAPLAVSGIRVTRAALGGNRQLTVRFTHNPQDGYFQGVNLYLRQKNRPALVIGAVTHSPAIVTLPKSSLASSVVVQSVGNAANLPLANSPGRAVNLA